MQRRIVRLSLWLGRCWIAALAAGLSLLATGSANADLVVSAQSVTAVAGSSGNAFDVTLTNTGPGSVGIGGFNFEVTVGPSITLTDVTIATTIAPYILDGLGVFGPDIATSSAGQDMTASDIFSIPNSGSTIGAGATVGLGHVFFDVSAGASNPQLVQFVAKPGTALSDFAGTDVPITAETPGTITITPGSVAAPTPGATFGGGVLFCFVGILLAYRRHRQAIVAER